MILRVGSNCLFVLGMLCVCAQAGLGSISSEIKSLEEQCMSMGIKHKNRKVLAGNFSGHL
jgi:hypothetical protein